MAERPLDTPPRVRLRPMRVADLDAFLAYRRDPEVARLQGWAPISQQEAAELLAANAAVVGFVPGQWIQIAIAELPGDGLIGDIGIHLASDQSVAEFGITITPTAQGRGYATEAIRGLIQRLFATTPVSTIIACTDVRNAPCIAALKRAGMTLDDVREAEYKGELCVEQIFSVQRPTG